MRSVFQRMARGLWAVSLEVGKRWWRHSHSRSAAALAFYSLFSMVPILVIVTGLASAFIGEDRAVEGVGQAAKELFDDNSGTYLRDLLSARPDDAFKGISSVIGFIVLFYTASRVVVELRETLMVVFGRKVTEGRHAVIIDWIKDQMIPILLLLALGIVLVVSAMAAAALQVIAVHLSDYLPQNFVFWGWMQKVVPLVIETLLFALILRWLPAKPPRFPEALIGAVVTCGLLLVLRSLIGFYFSQSSVTTAYGAAVTLVVVLLWIYFTIQIFFIGAETSAYFARKKADDVLADEPEGL
jgi:membrane protein